MNSVFRTALGSVIVGFLLSTVALAGQLSEKKALTLDMVKKIAAAAEEEAIKNKWAVVIAIVDEGANLIYLQRLDEAQIGSIEVAIKKARSAALFKRPTKAFEDALAGGRMGILALPGAIPSEGGVPIVVDGKPIGAIGVSGVTSAQDGQIAKAGVDTLAKMLGQ